MNFLGKIFHYSKGWFISVHGRLPTLCFSVSNEFCKRKLKKHDKTSIEIVFKLKQNSIQKKRTGPCFRKFFQQISPLCWDIFLILMCWGVAKLIPSNHLCEGPYSLSLIEKRKTQTFARKWRTYLEIQNVFPLFAITISELATRSQE